jgi:hypothetical protein
MTANISSITFTELVLYWHHKAGNNILKAVQCNSFRSVLWSRRNGEKTKDIGQRLEEWGEIKNRAAAIDFMGHAEGQTWTQERSRLGCVPWHSPATDRPAKYLPYISVTLSVNYQYWAISYTFKPEVSVSRRLFKSSSKATSMQPTQVYKSGYMGISRTSWF